MTNNFGADISFESVESNPDLLRKLQRFSLIASIIVLFTGVAVINCRLVS